MVVELVYNHINLLSILEEAHILALGTIFRRVASLRLAWAT